MEPKAGAQSNSWAGFAENDGASCDPSLARKRERATTWAVMFVGVAVVMGIAPNWFVGRSFIWADVETGFAGQGFTWSERHSHTLWFLATHDAVWGGAIGFLSLIPVWFWWWRRSAAAFGAAIGVMLSVAAVGGIAYCATTERTFARIDATRTGGTCWTLYAAAFLFAAAFLVAPPPRAPESINALQVRGLVRRHRKTA